MTHEHDQERPERTAAPEVATPDRAPEAAVLAPGMPALTPSAVIGLQRRAGNSATTAMLNKRPAGGGATIFRKKAPVSPFPGSAGTADARAGEAGAGAGGIAPIKVSQDYALQQAKRKEEQMDAFRRADIPFVNDNMDHYAYKKLVELRQEYVDDSSRISLAEGAFNDFVVPGTLANKSAAAFKAIQFELGYFDDTDPTEDLSEKDKSKLAKKLDEAKIKTLNDSVSAKEATTNGLRTEILGTSHNVQAAMQKRAAVLAVEQRGAAEAEKTKIDEKIKAVKDGIETVGTVIGAVSFAGFGAPAAIAEVAGGGVTAIKGGLELGEKGTGMVGTAVEFIMTEMYKEQMEKAKQDIQKAKTAEEHAKKMDAELSLTASMFQVEGQLQQLSGAMAEMALALKARKQYFAELGMETDKATGSKQGGKMSQYLAYVSQASETKSHLETANSSAENGLTVMKSQISEMTKHRNYSYVADSEGVWGNRRFTDGDGPDLEQLKSARDGLEGFLKASKAQLGVIGTVMGSMPRPE